MKGREGKTEDFRVPLSAEALRVIEQAKSLARDGWLFPSVRKGVISDATMSRLMERRGMKERPHGFRSSLRDWIAEATTTPHEIAETVFGHSVGNPIRPPCGQLTGYPHRRVVCCWLCYQIGTFRQRGRGYNNGAVMSAFRAGSIIAFVFAVTLNGTAHAKEYIYGCWSDIHLVPVDPQYSPNNITETSEGDLLCFDKNGTIVTEHFGGFEFLGTQGKFSYKGGNLVLTKKEIVEGWPFAFKNDRCKATVSSDQLTITGCKGWEASKALILQRQTNPLDLKGIQSGLFQ